MTHKAQMPIQSPTPIQAKTTVNQMAVKQQQVRPQVQLHQGAQVIAVPGLQFKPETVKLQLPVQIQQQNAATCQSGLKSQQVQNVVTLQTASVQEQLQRIQQLREQQQQKKRQQQEAKREQQQQAVSQSDLIQKQVSGAHSTTGPRSNKYTAHVRKDSHGQAAPQSLLSYTCSRASSYDPGKSGPQGEHTSCCGGRAGSPSCRF